MKKLLTTLLLTLSLTANAQLTVVLPFAAGSIVDLSCRKLVEVYDNMHNTNSTFMNMPGADHIIAHKHFITMTEPALLCAGTGVGGFNQHNNPKLSPSVDTLKPVVEFFAITHFILAPSSGPNTLEEIMSHSKRTGKSILVGAPSTNAADVLTHVLAKNNVKFEIVSYKKPTDSIVSLADGSLDTYVDGGSIKLLGELSGVKEIAHITVGEPKTKTVNLMNKYPILENTVSRVIIYARANMSDNEIQVLNTRLNTVMNSDQFQSFRKERLSMVQMTNGTVKQANQTITNIGVYLKNVHN
jgi:tripartite-type tricarboxylate transporter receptor subunit TctC